MTFSAYETSVQNASPVELYRFSIGNQNFHFTSSDLDYVINSVSYLSRSIERTIVDETIDREKAGVSLTVPRDFEIAELYRVYPPTNPVVVTIMKVHENDPDQETQLIWKGQVAGVKWLDVKAKMSLESMSATVKRNGLRRAYQKGCPHVLYGNKCGVSKDAFRVSTTLTNVTNNVITSSAFSGQADGYYSGGWVEFLNAFSVYERRLIIDHVGNDITVDFPSEYLAIGASVAVFAGCARNLDDCQNKFNNLLNYGGQPFIPNRNPFTKSAR